jgi:hypothetical protein
MNGESCPLKHFGFDSQGNKKQVCLGFSKGHCTYGLKCKFLHHAFDPVTQTWREACVQHVNYKCTRGDECPLLHIAARKKTKTDLPRSRGPRQEAKGYPAKRESLRPAWSSPPQETRNSRHFSRMVVQREVLQTGAKVILIRLDYKVGIDDLLGMLSWCGLEPYMFDLVLPPAAIPEHGFIRFTAPEYAARFVEACDVPGCVCFPAGQNVVVLLREFADRLPRSNDDPLVLLTRDNGRVFVHVKLFELLDILRREPISNAAYPEHGRVISEPQLKNCLNRPRYETQDASCDTPAKNNVGIRLEECQGRW